MWSVVGCVQQLGEPLLDRAEVQVTRSREPTTEHEHLRVEQVGEVVQPERHPVNELVDHSESLFVALSRGLLHVLPAYVERIATCELQHTTQPLGDRGLTRQGGQAAACRIALPA